MLTIWDLLAAGVIVAHDKEMGLIVLWNTNEILRMFRVHEKWFELVSYPEHIVAHYYEEIDVKTVDLSVNISSLEKCNIMTDKAAEWLQEDGT
jgi:hypothetical protein